MRPSAIALALIATTTTPALADETAETARRWGLLGVWKGDCRKGASLADVAFRYIVRSGRLYQERDIGNDGKDANVVSHAESLDRNSIELTVIFPPPAGPRILLLKRESGDRLLVWSSRTIGSTDYFIKDGKFTDGNTAQPLLTHCSTYGDK